MSASTNYDEVGKLSARRLRQVLAEMVTCDAVLTVANLCQTAGISRTALYRYHSDVLRELKEAQRRRGSSVIGGSQQLSRLRSENDVLKAQLMEVAALVDHYFAAWQETSVLIKRQEDELSSLRKQFVYSWLQSIDDLAASAGGAQWTLATLSTNTYRGNSGMSRP